MKSLNRGILSHKSKNRSGISSFSFKQIAAGSRSYRQDVRSMMQDAKRDPETIPKQVQDMVQGDRWQGPHSQHGVSLFLFTELFFYLALDELALEAGEPVYEEYAVQVVYLVLEHPRKQL